MSIAKNKFESESIANALNMAKNFGGRARRAAYWSRIGWTFDLEPRLRRLTKPFADDTSEGAHVFYVNNEIYPTPRFQVSALPNYLLPSSPKDTDKFSREDSAALVYSMHVSGMVVVSIWPHKSNWSSFGEDKHFVIDHYRSTAELAGLAGDSAITKHLKIFLKMINMSMAVQRPSRASQRFLRNLERRHDYFKSLYTSRGEHKRAVLNAEVALGAGLVGGLIASTILPFAQTFGKEKADSAQRRKKYCEAHYKNEVVQIEKCLEYSNYKLDLHVASALSTGPLLIVSLILALGCIMVMMKRMRQR